MRCRWVTSSSGLAPKTGLGARSAGLTPQPHPRATEVGWCGATPAPLSQALSQARPALRAAMGPAGNPRTDPQLPGTGTGAGCLGSACSQLSAFWVQHTERPGKIQKGKLPPGCPWKGQHTPEAPQAPESQPVGGRSRAGDPHTHQRCEAQLTGFRARRGRTWPGWLLGGTRLPVASPACWLTAALSRCLWVLPALLPTQTRLTPTDRRPVLRTCPRGAQVMLFLGNHRSQVPWTHVWNSLPGLPCRD